MMLSSCTNIGQQLTNESNRLSNKRPKSRHQSRLDLLATSSSDNLEAGSSSCGGGGGGSGSGGGCTSSGSSQSCSSITDHGYLRQQQQQQQQQQLGPKQLSGLVDNQANGHFVNSDGSIYSLVNNSNNNNNNYIGPAGVNQHLNGSSLKQANIIAEQQQQRQKDTKPVETSFRNQEQHRRLQYQVHQQLQKIYGNKLHEFEQHNQIQLQRQAPSTLSSKRKSKTLVSQISGRIPGEETMMRSHHQCSNHAVNFQDRTYDSLDLSQSQAPINHGNNGANQKHHHHHHDHQHHQSSNEDDFYAINFNSNNNLRQQQQLPHRSRAPIVGPIVEEYYGAVQDEEVDEDDEDNDDEDVRHLDSVDADVDGHNMVSVAAKRLDSELVDDRNRQLESLHYATATAAALLNVTASAAAAFAAANQGQNTARTKQAPVLATNRSGASRRPPIVTTNSGQRTRLANNKTTTNNNNNNRRRIYSDMYQDVVGQGQQRLRCQSEPYHHQAVAARKQPRPPGAISRQRAPIYSTASERTADMVVNQRYQQPLIASLNPEPGPQLQAPPRPVNQHQQQLLLANVGHQQQVVPALAPKARPPPPSSIMLQQLEWLKMRQQQQHQMQLLQRQQQLQQLYHHHQQQQQQPLPQQAAQPTLALLQPGAPMKVAQLPNLKSVAMGIAGATSNNLTNQHQHQHQPYNLQTNDPTAATATHHAYHQQARPNGQMAIYGLVDARSHMVKQHLLAPPRAFVPIKALTSGAPSDSSGHSDAPLVVDRSLMKSSFIEKVCNIDLKLFWWSLLIVSALFIAAFFTITRHVLHQ